MPQTYLYTDILKFTINIKNMRTNLRISFLHIFFHFIFVTNTNCKLTSVINTDKGPVRGEIRTTIRNNIKFSAFRGIRYGKPPIGRLRFMPPEEAESWTEILNATSEATPCPQMDMVNSINYIGDEDCLNLNVYTPRLNFNNIGNNLLAVMIWLYGGRYQNGYTNITYFGPDYLIENNVVVVAMNFRLGALGYLALNHTNASGNSALKDQRLAFKWVKRNIKAFGGDPNNVTIFGESTGGSAVDLHVLSHSSRGLFHRSISMSASPLCAWASATISEIKSQSFHLGQLLGIHTNDTQQLLTSMYDVPAENIVRATSMISTNLRPFKPIIEDSNVSGASVFLSECSLKKYKSGKFVHLPHMTGFLMSEALLFFNSFPKLVDVGKTVSQQSSLIMADIPPDVISKLSNITGGLPQSVIGDAIDEIIKESITNVTEILYTSPIDSKREFMQKFCPVYYYKISIAPNAALHKYKGLSSMNGAAHGDDVAYLWYTSLFDFPTNASDPFVLTRDRMTRMWTNFAKYSNPTPFGMKDPILNVRWPVSGGDGNHLEINNVLSVGKRSTDSITKKIQAVYIPNFEKFSGCT